MKPIARASITPGQWSAWRRHLGGWISQVDIIGFPCVSRVPPGMQHPWGKRMIKKKKGGGLLEPLPSLHRKCQHHAGSTWAALISDMYVGSGLGSSGWHLACLVGWTGRFSITLSTAHSLATDFNWGSSVGPSTQNQHVLPQGQASTPQRLSFEVGAPVKGTKDGFVDTSVRIAFPGQGYALLWI